MSDSDREKNKIILAPNDSPYRILDVHFDADSKAIIKAMRVHMVKNTRQVAAGNKAQKRLTDPRQRAETDALCRQVDQPELDVSHLSDRVDHSVREQVCPVLERMELLSDLYFPESIKTYQSEDLDFEEIPFRDLWDQQDDK